VIIIDVLLKRMAYLFLTQPLPEKYFHMLKRLFHTDPQLKLSISDLYRLSSRHAYWVRRKDEHSHDLNRSCCCWRSSMGHQFLHSDGRQH